MPASRILLQALFWITATVLAAQEAISTPRLSLAEMEEFLRSAKVVSTRNLSTGITNSRRAVLDNGQFRHDAHIQTINESKTTFQGTRGTELNFRDSYKYNVAAYELSKLLDLPMIPPSVERRVAGRSAAVTWWVDEAEMTEAERIKKKIQPPDTDYWNQQMHVVRVFDQLIHNMDRNLGNLAITKDWRIWMIDHTRAFRLSRSLENPKNLARCDRKLFAKLKELDGDTLRKRLQPHLTTPEIEGLLSRRDAIVAFFETEIAAKGEAAILYDLPLRD